MVIKWIKSLENGRFIKYAEILRRPLPPAIFSNDDYIELLSQSYE